MKKFVRGLLGSVAALAVFGTGASAAMAGNLAMPTKLKTMHKVECVGSDGQVKWVEEIHNLVVTAGFNDLLAKYFKGSSYTAAWYVGLKGTGTVAAGDTMASHAGWTEIAAYSESVRQTLTLGTPASGSVDNSASKAVFTINGSATVDGAFVTTDNTKSGTTGTLYGASSFSSSRAVISGDVLNVTITLSVS